MHTIERYESSTPFGPAGSARGVAPRHRLVFVLLRIAVAARIRRDEILVVLVARGHGQRAESDDKIGIAQSKILLSLKATKLKK